MRLWAASAALALGLWFLLAGTLSGTELLVGGVVACFAATGAYAGVIKESARYAPTRRDLAAGASIPRALVTETWGVLVVLARHLFTSREAESLVLEAPFERGADDDARDAARRALAETYATATPRAVVLGYDEEKKVVLYHLLEPGPVPDALTRLRSPS